ncbi:glucose 1-dehydrogenase [Castellaniella sp.]|uniref:glucose 1-dehydrogenase n=1 Tax=Castellaniella sp. TaxID=1955812 RepID=UPI00355D2890
MQRFRDRTVIVTGGGGGIGGATARRLAQESARVGVLDLNHEAAEAVVAQIREAGGQAAAFQCDITERAQVEAAVAGVQAQLGPIDALVNNAGWDIFKPFVKTVPAEWDRIIAINLVGALHMLHVVLPQMVERGYGRIVNVASDAARGGSSGEAVYSACKGGLVSIAKTLAREHARHGITVNVVCPGPTETALLDSVTEGARDPAKLVEAFRSAIPLGRLGKGEDLAAAIAFFASDDAGFVTGQVLSVSGGLTMHG